MEEEDVAAEEHPEGNNNPYDALVDRAKSRG
jgi:hypothetical protein